MLAAAQQAIDSFSYLREVDEDVIWQFYQPALVFAILNESQQGKIDEDTKLSLQKMRFKWLNARVTNIEQTIQNGGQMMTPMGGSQQIIHSQQPSQPQEGDLHNKVYNLESQLKMCQHVYSRLDEQDMPKLRKDMEEQNTAMMPKLMKVVEDQN